MTLTITLLDHKMWSYVSMNNKDITFENPHLENIFQVRAIFFFICFWQFWKIFLSKYRIPVNLLVTKIRTEPGVQISTILLAASHLSLQSQGANFLFKMICNFPFFNT